MLHWPLLYHFALLLVYSLPQQKLEQGIWSTTFIVLYTAPQVTSILVYSSLKH